MAVSITDLLAAIHVEDTAANQTAVTRGTRRGDGLVEKYAPDAPDAVKDQATVQAVGYIWESPASAPARMNLRTRCRTAARMRCLHRGAFTARG